MSSKSKGETLKRPRGSNTSITSNPRMAKRTKESGEFNDEAHENIYDAINPFPQQSSIGSSGDAEVSTLQASLGDSGAAGPSQPLRDAIVPATGARRFSLRQKKLKHSQSLDRLADLGMQSSAIQGRPGRQRSASLSSNEADGLVTSIITPSGNVTPPRSNQGFGRHNLSKSLFICLDDSATTDEDIGISTAENDDGPVSSRHSVAASDRYTPSNEDPESPQDKSGDYEPDEESSSDSSPAKPCTTSNMRGNTRPGSDVASDSDSDAAAGQDKKAIEEFTTTLLAVVQKLGISKEHIISIFSKLGMPLSMDRIEVGSLKPGQKEFRDTEKRDTKHYTASTVTQKILETYGSWEFENRFKWNIEIGQKEVEPMPAADVYQPLSMEGDFVDITDSPIGTQKPTRTLELHIQILRALRGAKNRMESVELKLCLPKDWEEINMTRLDENLDLPQEYKKALANHKAKPATKSLDIEHSSPLAPHLVDATDTERRQNYWARQTTPESPLSKGTQKKSHGSPDIPSPPPRHGSLDFGPIHLSVVKRLIHDHNLRPTLEGATKLESLLKAEKVKFAHQKSHVTLCQRLGTADERSMYQEADAFQGAAMFGLDVKYPSVQYTPRDVIESRDRSERSGNAAINENARDPKYGAARRVLDWIDFVPVPNPSPSNSETGNNASELESSANLRANKQKEASTGEGLTEVMVEERCGMLVKGMFWGHEHVNESQNKIMQFLQCLHLFGTDPKADYAVRLSGDEWKDWGALMAICILSGECKKSGEFTQKTEAQLAMNSVPALTMFILLHLSTRTTADQPLPPWMWKYAFVYTELGVTIYAHFPKLVMTDDGEARWKFVSWKLCDDFKEMWAENASDDLRMRGRAVMDMMRSHTEFLLEQLLSWSKNLPESAVPIMDTLIARVHLEMGDHEWLQKRAQEKELEKGAKAEREFGH